MTDSVTTEWIGAMIFETGVEGHKMTLDSEEQFGGRDAGMRPKPLILSALSGCTAMDVISIITKKKVPFKKFRISVTGELAEEHPKIYIRIHIVYELWGKDFSGNEEVFQKVKRSVDLSLDKYCAVAAMLKKACELSFEIRLLES
jgi:putative redox protein